MAGSNIDLKILAIHTEPTEYQLVNGNITLFITDSLGVEMPMGPRLSLIHISEPTRPY